MSPPRVLLATIGAAHGVRGEVRVRAHTDDPTALGSYGPLISEDGRVFEIERLRPAKDVVIARFRGVNDRNAAEALTGLALFIDRDRLPAPEEDEFYHADLIGLAAETEAGEPLGTIVAIHNFGAGDILDIKPPGGNSLLVPFTRAAVPRIDVASGRLVVLPPAEVEASGEEAHDDQVGA